MKKASCSAWISVILFAALSLANGNAQQNSGADHKAHIDTATWPIGFPGIGQQELTLGEWMKVLHVPAVSIAVIDDYKIAWTAQYGLADVTRGNKATAETLFQAASISKSVNAFGVMRLVESGRLSLDADVNQYLKTWKVPENEFTKTEKVTLRRILSHTAGINVHGFDGYSVSSPRPTMVQILNGLKPANSPPIVVDMVPGSAFRYSGGGVLVSQLLITDVTNDRYERWMQQNVLDAIGMTNSSFLNPPSKPWVAHTATGYRGTGTQIDGRWAIYPEMAAAGLWTTPTDLAQFGIEVMRALKGDSRLLSKSMAEQMLAEQKDGAALGLFVNSKSGQFGHNGSDEGFTSMMVCFRNGKGAVLMSNSDTGTYVEQRLLWSIAREYGWDFPVPQGQAFADVLFTLAMRDGATAAIAAARETLKDTEHPLPHGPRVALNAAYGLIDAHRWNDALSLLEFQLELAPNNDDVYEARAHIYKEQGKRTEALLAVKRALEINPKNDNAKKLLEKLQTANRSGQ
jgi:CubicO group peptidase (beta-lactamase class C family)